MGRDAEYEALLSKYRISMARNKDLVEQKKDSDQAWAKVKSAYKVTEDLARDLCTDILGKDRKEMVLGGQYTWDEVPIHELLRKAKDSYDDYCKGKTNTLRFWQKKCDEEEECRKRIEDALLSALMSGGLDKQEANKYITEVKNGKNIEAVIDTLPMDLKNAAISGEVTISIHNDEEMDMRTQQAYTDAVARANAPIAATTAVIIEDDARKEQKKKIKEQQNRLVVQDEDRIIGKLDAKHWAIMRALGADGKSRYKQIETAALQYNDDVKSASMRTAMKELCSFGLVDTITISTPIAKTQKLHCLSEAGKHIYKRQFEEDPVVPEMEQVQAEHDNYEHGYGILEAAEILTDAGIYKKISTFNRQKPVKLKNGRELVPDIIAVTNKGVRDFYEYERDTHKQADFNDKCAKTFESGQKTMHILAPNKGAARSLMLKTDKWLSQYTVKKGAGWKLKISSLDFLRTHNIQDEDAWLVIYDFDHGIEPVKMDPSFVDAAQQQKKK